MNDDTNFKTFDDYAKSMNERRQKILREKALQRKRITDSSTENADDTTDRESEGLDGVCGKYLIPRSTAPAAGLILPAGIFSMEDATRVEAASLPVVKVDLQHLANTQRPISNDLDIRATKAPSQTSPVGDHSLSDGNDRNKASTSPTYPTSSIEPTVVLDQRPETNKSHATTKCNETSPATNFVSPLRRSRRLSGVEAGAQSNALSTGTNSLVATACPTTATNNASLDTVRPTSPEYHASAALCAATRTPITRKRNMYAEPKSPSLRSPNNAVKNTTPTRSTPSRKVIEKGIQISKSSHRDASVDELASRLAKRSKNTDLDTSKATAHELERGQIEYAGKVDTCVAERPKRKRGRSASFEVGETQEPFHACVQSAPHSIEKDTSTSKRRRTSTNNSTTSPARGTGLRTRRQSKSSPPSKKETIEGKAQLVHIGHGLSDSAVPATRRKKQMSKQEAEETTPPGQMTMLQSTGDTPGPKGVVRNLSLEVAAAGSPSRHEGIQKGAWVCISSSLSPTRKNEVGSNRGVAKRRFAPNLNSPRHNRASPVAHKKITQVGTGAQISQGDVFCFNDSPPTRTGMTTRRSLSLV